MTKVPDTNALPYRIHLQAIDAARNIARDYQIYVACDLFGHWIINTHWGRIGTRGQQKTESFLMKSQASRHIQIILKRRSYAKQRIGVAYVFI
jgi:predicted DNA-binding WGR domain protein